MTTAIVRVAGFYAVGIVLGLSVEQARIMVYVTQGRYAHLRNDMFASYGGSLPIKYFDTHAHGDIMSVYTNDIDTLRQMICQSIPQVFNSGIYDYQRIDMYDPVIIFRLRLVTLVMVGVMMFVSQNGADRAGNIFLSSRKTLVTNNGFIEEMMSGQKVVKVFCHEEETNQTILDELNEKLFRQRGQCAINIRTLPGTGQRPAWKYQLCDLARLSAAFWPERSRRIHPWRTGELPDF